jgi:hypothetical protein
MVIAIGIHSPTTWRILSGDVWLAIIEAVEAVTRRLGFGWLKKPRYPLVI